MCEPRVLCIILLHHIHIFGNSYFPMQVCEQSVLKRLLKELWKTVMHTLGKIVVLTPLSHSHNVSSLHHPPAVIIDHHRGISKGVMAVHVCMCPSTWSDFFKLDTMRYLGGLMHIKQILALCQNVAIMHFW